MAQISSAPASTPSIRFPEPPRRPHRRFEEGRNPLRLHSSCAGWSRSWRSKHGHTRIRGPRVLTGVGADRARGGPRGWGRTDDRGGRPVKSVWPEGQVISQDTLKEAREGFDWEMAAGEASRGLVHSRAKRPVSPLALGRLPWNLELGIWRLTSDLGQASHAKAQRGGMAVLLVGPRPGSVLSIASY
jgi:hypothetical protein